MQGFTDAIFSLSSELYVELGEVYACAEEINLYLQDFTKWDSPIFPVVPGCPQPEFDPGYFVDGGTGNDWICPGDTSKFLIYVISLLSWAVLPCLKVAYLSAKVHMDCFKENGGHKNYSTSCERIMSENSHLLFRKNTSKM